MPTLRELQTTFMESLSGTVTEPVLALMTTRGAVTAARLRVYQNNRTATFGESLRASFPAIARLVGDDYFRQLARGFQERHPSRSGDLLWIGQHFPGYLEGLLADGEFGYLTDVARLEWLCQESLRAADHATLDLGKLADMAANYADSLVFLTAPSLRSFESRYPALRIWESNVLEHACEGEIIDLASAADCLLLLRHHATLKFHRLNAHEHRFLMGLLERRTFASIVDRCSQQGDFDAEKTLQRFVGIGAVVDCQS